MPARLKQRRAYMQAHVSLQNLFADYLGLSLHAVEPGKLDLWYELFPPPAGLAAVQFEVYFKRLKPRYRAFEQAFRRAAKGPAEAEHAGLGFSVAPAGGLRLVAASYLTQLPTAADLRRRFTALAGRAAGANEELFESYCRAMLDAPLIAPQGLAALRQALQAAGEWYFGGEGPSAEGIEALKPVLARACPRRMEHYVQNRRERILWWAALAQGWSSWDRRDFGGGQAPGAVLAFSLAQGPGPDERAESLVQAARLRQAAFELAAQGGAIAGRALGEGACWLLPRRDGGAAGRQQLLAQAQAARQALSRAVGAPVAVGVSEPLGADLIPEAYRQAEWALLMGLQRQESVSRYEKGREGQDPALDGFEAGLALQRAVLAGNPEQVRGAQDALLGSAGRVFPGRSDLQRPQLLQAVLQLFEALRRRGLDEGAWDRHRNEALRALREARHPRELVLALGQVVGRLQDLARSPRAGSARLRVAGLRRTLAEDAAEHDLAWSAQAAGLSPSRFSRLFRQESGDGFGQARRRQRLEQAGELLAAGDLPVWRVAQECGYRSASHFGQAFLAQQGLTPGAYRRQARLKAKKQTTGLSK